MNNLCKALLVAVGGVIVYAVATKVADKFCDQPTQDDIEDELDEEVDGETAEVVKNIFHKIGKGINGYMAAQTTGIKEKIGFCKEVLNSAQNRLTIGIIVLASGIGIGSGLIASACIKLPE